MAGGRDKVTVRLDARIVEQARAELGVESEADATVVARAFNAYLIGRVPERTQAAAGLSEEEAERLAYEELRAQRNHVPRALARSPRAAVQRER